MAFGLITYASDGAVKIEASDRITRHYARYSLTVPAWASATITIPGFSTDGTWGVTYKASVPALIPYMQSGSLRFVNQFNTTYAVDVEIWRV